MNTGTTQTSAAPAVGQEKLAALFDRSPKALLWSVFREDRFFLVLSVFIGVFSGLAVVCFRFAIDWCRIYLLGSGIVLTPARLVLAPTLAGLVIAALVMRVFPLARGSGVNQTKAALYIYNGYIPLRTAVGKFITAALAIGSGHSLGPEDPSLQIGASLASALGRRMNLSRDRMRLIAPVGAAAGLAAAFNAPISAVLFVIEEVIGRWTAGILGSVVLSAVSSVVVMRWFLGSESLFRIPAVEMRRPSELLAYSVLGLVGGLASVMFSAGITTLRPRCKALPRWTQYFQPALAGLLIGMIAVLGAPQVMGAGYEYIDEAMHGRFTWQFLAILAGLKILATMLSFVSGTPGGMFAPTLFIGAMLGAAVGGAQHALLPHLKASPGTYALVGMGVLFAGFLRAPMTSVFMVLEVSGNYSIILPVIVANTFAYVISRSLQPIPIFDVLTRQDGLELPSMEEQREEDILR
ncbi:MAG TPA: chloride channel protein, partial [Candidatus Acidoferrales bacterium]|nr:chloride channel protein [Candidatus Acidoferrales bacterium]